MKAMHLLVAMPAFLAAMTHTAVAQRRAPPPPVRYQDHISAGGNPPPAGTLQNPYKGNAQAAKDGAKMFSSFNCDGCHAGGAVGAVGPSLADGRWRYGGSDGEIYQSIFYGRPRGMPAWGGTLPPQAIWMLVTYLQSLQPAKDTISTTRW